MTDAAVHPLKRNNALSAERPTEKLEAAAKAQTKGKSKKAKDPESVGKERVCFYLDADIDRKVRLMSIEQRISMSAVVSKLIAKAPMPDFS